MRSTRTIKTGGAEVLFSPVHARTLRRGDLVAVDLPDWDPFDLTVARVEQVTPDGADVLLALASQWVPRDAEGRELPRTSLGVQSRGVNAQVLRAVGAAVGGLL